MWLKRQLDNINKEDNAVLFMSRPSDGYVYIFAELRDKYKNVVWLEITDKEKNDPVALGNILSDAVKKALGSKLFDYGLPYQYGLKVLENQLELLGPFYFLVSRADNNLQFSQDILKLNKKGSKVILSFCNDKNLAEFKKIPLKTSILEPKELSLKKQEAKDMAASLSEEAFIRIWESSQGKYLVFLDALNKHLGLAAPKIPSPNSDRVLDKNAYEVDPDLLLDILIKQERWLDVLEIAVPLLPYRVPEIIAKAGYHYNELGQTKRLWELLSDLPRAVQLQEEVLFWLLSSAFWQGKAEGLRADVEAHLNNNDAAELRALYAGILAAPEDRLKEARAAYKISKTSFTTYMLASFEHDIDKRIDLMQDSVKLAELTNKSYEIVRNATGLVRILTYLGNYQDALFWSIWARSQAEKFKLKNDPLRLWLNSHWAYLSTILSEGEDIYSSLHNEVNNIKGVAPHLEIVYRENLGDYLLSQGNIYEALNFYKENWKTGNRQYMGRNAFNLAKVYLWLGDYKRVFKIVSQAKALTTKEQLIQHNYLDLAFAAAMALVNKKKGLEQLLELKNSKSFVKWRSGLKLYLVLYLAWVYVEIGRKDEARAVLSKYGEIKLPNSGLLTFAGPADRFKQVWLMIGAKNGNLELKFVGDKKTFYYKNKEITLTFQEQEILAILVNNPQGVSIEQLALMLSYDGINTGRIKSAITRLRKKVPISKEIYTITVSYSADFLEIMALAKEGQLQRAINMYKQPLLNKSNAPEISRIREILNNTIRNSLLISKDSEILTGFAEREPYDLEVWERLLELLPSNDTRIPYVRARIKQLLKEWE